jgi:hypothetical protein
LLRGDVRPQAAGIEIRITDNAGAFVVVAIEVVVPAPKSR